MDFYYLITRKKHNDLLKKTPSVKECPNCLQEFPKYVPKPYNKPPGVESIVLEDPEEDEAPHSSPVKEQLEASKKSMIMSKKPTIKKNPSNTNVIAKVGETEVFLWFSFYESRRCAYYLHSKSMYGFTASFEDRILPNVQAIITEIIDQIEHFETQETFRNAERLILSATKPEGKIVPVSLAEKMSNGDLTISAMQRDSIIKRAIKDKKEEAYQLHLCLMKYLEDEETNYGDEATPVVKKKGKDTIKLVITPKKEQVKVKKKEPVGFQSPPLLLNRDVKPVEKFIDVKPTKVEVKDEAGPGPSTANHKRSISKAVEASDHNTRSRKRK